jgi:hypothetical protein
LKNKLYCVLTFVGSGWNGAIFYACILFAGFLVGYRIPDIFRKSYVAEKLDIHDSRYLVPRDRQRSNQSGIQSLSLGFVQDYLVSQLSWLPDEDILKTTRSWKDIISELGADHAGEFAYDSLALVVFDEMAWQNPGELFNQLIESKNLQLRTNQLEVLLFAWEQSNPGAAKYRIDALPVGSLKVLAENALMKAMVDKNPPAAFKQFLSSPHLETCDVYRLFGNWARTNEKLATTAALSIEDPALRERAIGGISGKLAKENQIKAWAWAGGLEQVEDKEFILNSIVRETDKNSIASVLTLLDEMSDLKLKNRLLLGNIARFADADFEKTFEYAIDYLNGEDLYVALSNCMPYAIEKDSDIFRNFVENLPTGDRKDSLVSQLYHSWMVVNVDAARDWGRKMDVAEIAEKNAEGMRAINWNF